MVQQKEGLILASIASIIFGLSITLNKFFLSKIDLFPFISGKFLFLSLFLSLILYFRKQNFKSLDKVQWFYVSGISLVWIFFSLAFHFGLMITLPTHASSFYIGFSIVALLLGVLFFRKNINMRKFFFIIF